MEESYKKALTGPMTPQPNNLQRHPLTGSTTVELCNYNHEGIIS
jgi:hypothetical protein